MSQIRPVTFEPLGIRHEGHELVAATLHGARGLRMRVLNLGGIVWSLEVPDAAGAIADVVLGYDDPAAYLEDRFYLGALVGRFSNRIANASFTLDGVQHKVTANQGRHHLHGGLRGFNRVVWDMRAVSREGAQGVELRHRSPHGSEGFPGELLSTVTYWLSPDGQWDVEFIAESDRPTPVNLTQHSYFNLSGAGSARPQRIRIHANRYLPTDGDSVPSGPLRDVSGSAWDLREPTTVADIVARSEFGPGSLDHSFAVRDWDATAPNALHPAATFEDPASGRRLLVETTAPSLHCYVAHYLENVTGKQGARYQPYDGICFEAQGYADAVNRPDLPSAIVRPGAPLVQRTRFTFSAPAREG